jgi:ribosome biogenesis protein ERB1
LTPQLPKPADLKPFPATESIVYTGHTGRVRSVSIDPKGQWMLSAADDASVRLWDVRSGRCTKVWRFPEGTVVYSVQFNPSSEVLLAAIALADQLLIVEPPFATPSQKINAEKLFAIESDNNTNDTIKALVSWQKPNAADEANGIRLRLQYHRGDKASLKSVVWHYRGDYVATVCPDASHNAVLIHQLTKRMSQSPFKKTYVTPQSILLFLVFVFLSIF